MPELFTVSDLVKRIGITRAAVMHRMKVIRETIGADQFGPVIKLSNGHVFTRHQAELICFGTGRKSNSKEYWHRLRAANSRSKRRRAS